MQREIYQRLYHSESTVDTDTEDRKQHDSKEDRPSRSDAKEDDMNSQSSEQWLVFEFLIDAVARVLQRVVF